MTQDQDFQAHDPQAHAPQGPEVDPAREPAAPRRSLADLLRGGVAAMFRLSVERSAARVGLVGLVFGTVFLALIGRLASFAMMPDDPGTAQARRAEAGGTTQVRPDIVDRNGEILATDIRTVSVFAEPKNIYDKDEAVELLTAVLPDINARDLREKLSSKKGFVWVKREITPRQQAEVHRLGIPGSASCPTTSGSTRTGRPPPTSSA